MRKAVYIAYWVCPIFTIFFSLITGFVTMYLENSIPPLFVFLSVQFYLNWYLVYNINRKVIIPFAMTSTRESQASNSTYWYCGKCKHYIRRPARHCPLCKKCFYYRDHHCYFLGSCILRQNMGNFILVCIYTTLACIYSASTLGSYLYDHFLQSDTTKVSVYYFALNFFFPITLAKFLLVGDESAHVFLVVLFNMSFSVACFSLFYGLWKLYSCLSGKQKYYVEDRIPQDIHEVFGSYGFLNFIFPFNGFLHSRSIDEKYELKSV